MQITSVNYQRLKSLPGYENEKVGASAVVEEGETAEDALTKLKGWVDEQLGDAEERNDLADQVSQLRYQKQGLERDVEAAKEQWEKAKAFLEKHGLDVRDDPTF